MATLFDADGNEFEVDDSLLRGNQGGEVEPPGNAAWAALRSGKKTAEEERDQARRELAFVKAGVNPEDARLSYFVKGYDGPSDPEKIREAAIAAGFLAAAPPTPEQQQQAEALGAQQRISGAAVAAQAAPDAEMARRQALDDAYKAGGMEGLTAAMNAAGIPTVLN